MNENTDQPTFEDLKQKAKRTDGMGAVIGYAFTESELTALLEAYDASKWRPYPCPEMLNGESLYLVTLPADQSVHTAYAMSFGALNVSGYCELPKPFNPEK